MKRALLVLAGSALFTLVSIQRLPSLRDLRRPVATPFDRSLSPADAPAFVLFSKAAPLVPPGSVVALEPRDPADFEYAFRLAAGLLPGRRILRPGADRRPDFVLDFGGERAPGRGRVLLALPWGALRDLRG